MKISKEQREELIAKLQDDTIDGAYLYLERRNEAAGTGVGMAHMRHTSYMSVMRSLMSGMFAGGAKIVDVLKAASEAAAEAYQGRDNEKRMATEAAKRLLREILP